MPVLTDPIVPLTRFNPVGRELDYVRDVLATGVLRGNGAYTERCGRMIEEMTGAGRALLTHSCTGALEMAAILCDLGPGDEVILPSYTFVSTANAVVLRGAVPVFVDVDPRTLNIAPEAAAAAVTARTKAIFAVHYAGFPADMDALAAIARAHGLMLVEDAAQALGSSYRGRPCGGLGDLAAFSFHETKNVISGEGGALAIARPDLVDRAEIIWEKGTNRRQFFQGLVDKYTWVDIGSSFLPGELIAAFLLAQLEGLEEINARRRAVFDRYLAAFADLAERKIVQLPHCPADCTGNGHLFYLLLPPGISRKAFIAHMAAAGIETPFHYIPLHSSPAGRRFGRAGDLPVTDDAAARLVRLPIHAGLGGEELGRVIDRAREFLDPL